MREALLILFFLFLPCSISFINADDADHVKELKVDDTSSTIAVYMDESFVNQPLTEKEIKKKYKKITKEVHKALPKEYKKYDVKIIVHGVLLEESIQEEPLVTEKKHKKLSEGWWGEISYYGAPWVKNISRPTHATAALNGKHISLWASHGRYYDISKGCWKWQRPCLFGTCEDLFTQTIVVPFLIPMLERAGAYVFTPRERDWQTEEVIVDNDKSYSGYIEVNADSRWTDAGIGFAIPDSALLDGDNPFTYGTVRQVNTTPNDNCSMAIYQPEIMKSGRYAVYVSYSTLEHSIDDALYSVYHQGMRTDFHVNQQMGGNTWVYLGTFDFDQGSSESNRVVVYSKSEHNGVVTTDAVRFGGGMGNISRGGSVSGYPRCIEGARYYAQWAGLPYELLSLYNGEDDYKDDINVRSLMTNWLAGGSVYAPDTVVNTQNKHVPIDLSLAIHSDAGYNKDMKSIFGSLAVCTTDFNDGKLRTGIERSHSKALAQMLLDNSLNDLQIKYGQWQWRDLYDRNYSETRLPAMPSAIFETLSHQSFPDMKLAHDPDFKFTLARSIYKTLLRYEAEAHGGKVIVSPLSPVDFSVTLDAQGNAQLSWQEQCDEQESTAVASSYNVYTAIGGLGYDNGVNVEQNCYTIPLSPDLMYRFRITAVNNGGESFPSEELSVVWHGVQAKNMLIINGFQRLAAPQIIDTDSIKGFDIDSDPGVSYGLTAGWGGKQQNFDCKSSSFGYSGSEMEGRFVAGNDFNYVAEHAEAAMSAGEYNIVSATRSVVERGMIDLSRYDIIDLLLGNERNDGYSLKQYKTFTSALQNRLFSYVNNTATSITGRHSLLVSGSYVASDMQTDAEKDFLQRLLHISLVGVNGRSRTQFVTGLQQNTVLTNTLNPDHYAATQCDVLHPLDNAFVAMQYTDKQTAAVAAQGYYNTFVMGFPFECITNSAQRAVIMRGILAFLTK